MSTQDIAKSFAALCKEGKFHEAGVKHWSDDVASIEAMGPDPATKGKKAVEKKGADWYAANTVHGAKIEGPFVNGDQFVLRFELDITPKGKDRTQMTEMGIYTVANGKIVEERFFY